jgi:HD-GYP domain-containing protein (c-di-GMP phosphodiesterase class II)
MVAIPGASWLISLCCNPSAPLQTFDLDVLRLASRFLQQHQQQHATYNRLQNALVGLVQAFATVIDAKDRYTCGHSERVARIGTVIGEQMGLSSKQLSDVFLSGLLHDIGKIGIRDDVLFKPGRLSDDEVLHIRQHPVIGDTIVANIRAFHHLRPGIRHHHERFDGAGYPDHLAGEGIPILGRILAVADACDAMMSSRRYRDGMTPPQIDHVFRATAGSQFDPDIVSHFMACRDRIYPPIYQKGIGESAYHAVSLSMSDEWKA